MGVSELNLRAMASQDEGQYFDRKSLFAGEPGRKRPRDRREVRDHVAEYVAAFANAEGGVLLLGVEDDATVTGHRYPPKVVDEILQVPSVRLSPRLPPGRREQIGGQEVLVFDVEAAAMPVMVTGNGFPYRVNDRVVLMPESSIAAIKQKGLVESWEAGPSSLSVEDLDQQLLERAIRGAALQGATVDRYLLRRRMADVRGGRLVLRRAAELLFARGPEKIEHPNAGARLFRVIGTERKFGVHHNVEELPRFEGSVAAVIASIQTAVHGLLRRPRRLRGLFFEEVPEYPTFAWQEAIVNAMAHRDYGIIGRAVEVWLYEDRMEVVSPGGLMAQVSLEALRRRERVHMSRNPRLVRGLVDLGLMREQGEGIPRMFAAMEVQFLAPPELEAGEHEFGVVLRNAPTITADDAEWLAGLEGEGLSESQIRAMALARTRGQVTNAALRDATGLDTLAASADLRTLRDRGLLDIQGAGSATFYVLGPRARGHAAGDGGEPPDRGEPTADRGELAEVLPEDRGELPVDGGELPAAVRHMIDELGVRPRRERLRPIIELLCALRPWRPAELARVLGFTDAEKLVERHLGPMVEEGILTRSHPTVPTHPEQAYRAARGHSVPEGDE